MTVPGVAWVTLIVMLLPVLAQFIGTQWPESNGYLWSGAIVVALGVVGKWLEMTFISKSVAATPPATDARPRSIGETGASLNASTPAPKLESRARRFLVG